MMQVLLCPLQSLFLMFTSAIAKYDHFPSSGTLNTRITSQRLSKANEEKTTHGQLLKEDCLIPFVSFPMLLTFFYNMIFWFDFIWSSPTWCHSSLTRTHAHSQASIIGFAALHPFLWLVGDAAPVGDCLSIHLFRNICWVTVIGQALL